ncbi:MAG: site-2 protease family protein [Candidatus Dormibacteraeota bacterium]|nr:site-2 protease family protein [Candidatus Dormibacteraeota bacterium]
MNGGLPIARIAGIRIRAHWSVLLISLLLTWGLAEGIIPATLPATPPALTWISSAAAALLLIASLTLHELAHSIVARRRGIPVEDITLWVFGGVSHIRGDWGSPRNEMLVAAVGPGVTFLIGGFCFSVSMVLGAAGAPGLLVLLLEWLAAVNALLLVFNLVPAFPLDGGRILRGLLWIWRKDRSWATINAARAGRVFALILAGLGFAEFLLTSDIGGLWLVLIGWFLDGAAKSELRGERMRTVLNGVRVAEVMTPNPMVVPSWITVQLLIDQYALRDRYTTFPTHGIDGRVDGLVTLTGMRRVPPSQRSARRGADVMIPITSVPITRPDELITDLLTRLGPQSEGHALVFDAGRLVGIVSPSDIGRRLALGLQSRPLVTPAPWAPPAR